MSDLHSGNKQCALRIISAICAAITIIVISLMTSGIVAPYAHAEPLGTLTIDAVWGRDTSSPKPLAGDTYSIVRVATVKTNSDGIVAAYTTVKNFAGFDVDWSYLTSSESNSAAKKLAAHAAKSKLYEHAGITNVSGQLTFRSLPLGLYLVSRTNVVEANKAYDCDPFLISIPGSGDTAADLNITVEPKFSAGTLVTPPENNPNKEPGNPGGVPEHPSSQQPVKPGVIGRTGAAVGSIAAAAGLMLLVAFVLFRLRMRRRMSDVNLSDKSHTDDESVMK